MKVKNFIPYLINSNPFYRNWFKSIQWSDWDIQKVMKKDDIYVMSKSELIGSLKEDSLSGLSKIFIDGYEYVITFDNEDFGEDDEYICDWVMKSPDSNDIIGYKKIIAKLNKLSFIHAYRWEFWAPKREKKKYKKFSESWHFEKMREERKRKVVIEKYYKCIQNFLNTFTISSLLAYDNAEQFQSHFNDGLLFLKNRRFITDDTYITDLKLAEFGFYDNMFYYEHTATCINKTVTDKYNHLFSTSVSLIRRLSNLDAKKMIVLADLQLKLYQTVQRAFISQHEYLHIANEVSNSKICKIEVKDRIITLTYTNNRSLNIKI